MSKRNSDGDVLTNRLNIGLAKHQKLLASWVGMQAESTTPSTALQDEPEDDDLKQESFGHDRLGVGGILPKDIADGSFTKRAPTSNDKLLEQLIGKKRAKAHLAAQIQTSRSGGQQQRQKFGKPKRMVEEDSEDEDEGRAAAFQSKRGKPRKVPIATVSGDASDESNGGETQEQGEVDIVAGDSNIAHPTEDESEDDNKPATASKAIPSRSKKKATSFLDELLAERSSKRKKKKN